MKFKKCAAIILCSALCVVPTGISASANSALLYWEGSYSAGAAAVGDCPLEVESELLTFDINEFPQEYYGDTDEDNENFANYGGKVTASYNFYNPEGFAVRSRLAFPFGRVPNYAYNTDVQLSKYGVSVNGKKIQATLRHTLSRDDFSSEIDLKRLVDGYMEDDFYSPDLPVYRYVFSIDGITYGGDNAVHAAIEISEAEGRKIMTDSSGYGSGAGKAELSWFVKNGQTVEIISLGKPMDESEFNFGFYYYGRFDRKVKVEGNAARKPDSDEILTFENLIQTKRKGYEEVSDTDWYNAVVEYLNTTEDECGFVRRYSLDAGHRLLRWYEYALEIPAGGKINNEVTAPVYPSIDGEYSPSVYGYEYLLSPAKGWKRFGKFEVKINTPFYLSKSSLKGFNKTDYGYYFSSETLPDGELTFNLCEKENPVRVRGSGCGCSNLIAQGIIPLAIITGALVLISGVTLLVVFLVKKKK